MVIDILKMSLGSYSYKIDKENFNHDFINLTTKRSQLWRNPSHLYYLSYHTSHNIYPPLIVLIHCILKEGSQGHDFWQCYARRITCVENDSRFCAELLRLYTWKLYTVVFTVASGGSLLKVVGPAALVVRTTSEDNAYILGHFWILAQSNSFTVLCLAF